jgi:hypothetical protein
MASCFIDFDDTRKAGGSAEDAILEIRQSYTMIHRMVCPLMVFTIRVA